MYIHNSAIKVNDNFFRFAMESYENPHCKSINEFNSDLQKITQIKKLISKNTNKRLILNHIIILMNVFERESCVRMLFYKIDKKYWHYLKTYLEYLRLMPEKLIDFDVYNTDIEIDIETANQLRAI